ncbi:MAG: PilW family protein [Thiobacillaceae bacterium]
MSRCSEPSGHKTQTGLTLVELLISLTLGLIITLAVGYLYINSRHIYRVNDNVARMQENGRYVMEMIGRDLRMAGYWGCASGLVYAPVNTLNNATDYAYKFDTPVEGHEATGTSAWVPAKDASITGALGGTDILTVRGVYDARVTVTSHPGGSPPVRPTSKSQPTAA